MSPLIRTTVQIKDAGLIKAYRDSIAQAPQLTAQVVTRTVNRVSPRILAPLRQAGSPVSYPLKWKMRSVGDKLVSIQRKAFFATNGFGKGIPYKRTGDLARAWKLGVTLSASEPPSIYLTNPISYRKFVTGHYQQPMFTGRWIKESVFFAQMRTVLADEVETDLIKLLFIIDEGNAS
jgi:hypothetical protein